MAIAIDQLTEEKSKLGKLLRISLADAQAASNEGRKAEGREITEHCLRVVAGINALRDRLMKLIGWPTPPRWGQKGAATSHPFAKDDAPPPGVAAVEIEAMDSPASPTADEPA